MSLDGEFIVTKEGEPTEAELNNHNVIKIIAQKCTDEEVNWLVWKCLGESFSLGGDGDKRMQTVQ